MQIVGEFPHGAGPVRDGVFLFGGHLGEGAVVAVGDEERVETEALVAGFVIEDAPLDDPLEEVLLAVEDQRDDRAEAGPAVGDPSRFFSSRRLLAAKSWPSVA